MGILYAEEDEIIINMDVDFDTENGTIVFEFTANIGKFRTIEPLAGYKLTPKRMLQILSERNDYTDDEL